VIASRYFNERIDMTKLLQLLSFFSLMMLSSISFAQLSYTTPYTENLPTGTANGKTTAINESGTTVGFYRGPGSSVTNNQFRGWTNQSGITSAYPTLTLGGPYLKFIDVNNNNVATGRSFTADNEFKAFTYDIVSATLTSIGTLGGANSYGEEINDNGVVVGISETATNELHAFSFSGSTMTDLGTFGGTASAAYGVNNNGTVVGEASYAGDSINRAFSSQGSFLTDLGSLGGSSSAAMAINENGWIVGQSATLGDAETHAVFFEEGGVFDMGTLGGDYSIARDVNDNNWIVGSSTILGGQQHGFLYTQEWGMLDLNDIMDLGSEWDYITEASGINNLGQIVGVGRTTDGTFREFTSALPTYTPVPVPAAAWLFASSLAGLLLAKRGRLSARR
jgi:probable HAF family extracellular repeat protein